MEVKTPDWRIIERYNKDGTITKIKVDWNKIPCSTCEWRYNFGCPHCEWNKDGKYNTYLGANEGYNIELFSNCFGGNCWYCAIWFSQKT